MANYGMSLAKGQEALMAINGKPIQRIRLEVGWHPIYGEENMDIDSSILVYQKEQPDIQELIAYFNKHSYNGSIRHNGDNLTGEDDYFGYDSEDGVDETIDVDLASLDPHYNRLAVAINIYDAHAKEQTFEDVDGLFIRIVNTDDGSYICNYKVTNKIYNDNTLVIGLFLKKGTEWIFKALGVSYDFDNIENFADMVAEH